MGNADQFGPGGACIFTCLGILLDALHEKKTLWSFSNLLFSFSLLMYMKVDEVFFIPVFILFYLLLDEKSVRKTINMRYSHGEKEFP